MVTATIEHRHVDTETGEIEDLSWVLPKGEPQSTLPGFEGFQVWRAKVKFSGAYELDLTDSQYRALADGLLLGESIELVVRGTVVGGAFKATDLEGRQAERGIVIKIDEVEQA